MKTLKPIARIIGGLAMLATIIGGLAYGPVAIGYGLETVMGRYHSYLPGLFWGGLFVALVAYENRSLFKRRRQVT